MEVAPVSADKLLRALTVGSPIPFGKVVFFRVGNPYLETGKKPDGFPVVAYGAEFILPACDKLLPDRTGLPQPLTI